MISEIKKIVVTGGAGFIGSHVVRLLCDSGYEVIVIDRPRLGSKKYTDKRAKFLLFSLEDTDATEKALDGVDLVIHLAASSIIGFSYLHPFEYFENNLTNGIKLLEAMKKKGVKKIIYSSTSSIYGQQKKMPIKENAPKDPLSIYAASKLAFEEALLAYYYSFEIESVTLRYFNVYGPRDEQEPRTRAIPMWIESILNNQPVFWYWQGKQIRDYVYVEDVAQAHLDVLPLKGIHHFNIGSGEGIVMENILKILEKIIGRKIKTVDAGRRKGDPMKAYADITKIKKITGWNPETLLEEGLKKTFDYYKKMRKI